MAKKMSVKEFVAAEDAEDRVQELAFEDGMKLLEDLVEKVESGSLALEQAVASYEKGMTLVDHLRGHLSRAEDKLKILKKD